MLFMFLHKVLLVVSVPFSLAQMKWAKELVTKDWATLWKEQQCRTSFVVFSFSVFSSPSISSSQSDYWLLWQEKKKSPMLDRLGCKPTQIFTGKYLPIIYLMTYQSNAMIKTLSLMQGSCTFGDQCDSTYRLSWSLHWESNTLCSCPNSENTHAKSSLAAFNTATDTHH